MNTAPTFVDVVNIAAYNPAETIELVSRMGVRKGNMSPVKVFMSAVYGGMFLSFGSAASLVAITVPWFQANAPGIPRLLGAMVFPLGLILVVLTGSDLFTASNMVGYLQVYILYAGYETNRGILVHLCSCPTSPLIRLEDAPPLVAMFLGQPRRFSFYHGHSLRV